MIEDSLTSYLFFVAERIRGYFNWHTSFVNFSGTGSAHVLIDKFTELIFFPLMSNNLQIIVLKFKYQYAYVQNFIKFHQIL